MTVVLLSGGADSVCLLHVLAGRLGAENVVALHVNYGLRPDADGDEAFCRELCASLGVELEVVRAGEPQPNLQAWARGVRYAEAERLAEQRDALVATGHTASDQVETVLYRLAASPGRGSLMAMSEREGRRWKPLLGWTREQTREYCVEQGLAWREDTSNRDPAYARNRVRHGLLAAMRDVHPAAEANVLRTLELLRDESEVLDAAVEEVLTDSLAELRELPPALRRLCLRRLGGSEVPALTARVEDILALPDEGSASLDVGGGWRAVAEYGRLRFEHGSGVPPAECWLRQPQDEVAFGDGTLTARVGSFPVGDGVLDAAALEFPLQVRAWRPGDRMRPLGLGGTKTLQDLFTDRKVPRARRARLPVVVSAGDIAWVPGVAIGERFRVTDETRERIRLAWQT